MQTAETLLGIIRERSQRKLPLENLYRLLYNKDLYLSAYGRLYRNEGAMTKGATDETVDGMSQEKIDAIIQALRCERYIWNPVRRVEIPKRNGKKRPLGIPSWSDKLVQEVVRMLLEAYYEPQFSDSSHGFRPQRGCHTALSYVQRHWKATKWFLEGDIKGCFDNIDPTLLLNILRESIHDNRFLRLMENMLKAGYMQDWKYHPTLSGAPQGGVVSPLLSNIYLDKLDKFVEHTLLPEYTRGEKRAANQDYNQISKAEYRLRKQGEIERARELQKQKRRMPSKDPNDPDYRRLKYLRYADDFLLGFVGPKAEAEEIKEKLKTFLQENLKLELSAEKTLITHATDDAARFLGYEITVQHEDTKMTGNMRSINGVIALRLPTEFLQTRSALYMNDGKPIHLPERINDDDFTIISRYQLEYRGYVQYYQLATNIAWLSKLHWVMRTSLLKTLACKHKVSMAKMVQKYTAKIETPHGLRTCLETIITRDGKKPLIARFGGIPLKRNHAAIIVDRSLAYWVCKRTELIKRLLADTCEICGTSEKVEVHHIRKMADVNPKGRKVKPDWMVMMSARRRKTLVLCQRCHDDLHAGRPLQIKTN